MSSFERLSAFFKKPVVFYGLVVLLLSYFTYVHNYTNPSALFWDENYHIASAQKYLNEVYFMEQHPPLAKMLIAFGEYIVDANPGLDDDFIGTDYAQNLPGDFSFAGYRLFPVLFSWLTALLFYGVFYLMIGNALGAQVRAPASMMLSFLYIFDNALIVHSRSAMLDSTMIFFAMSVIFLSQLVLIHRNSQVFMFYSVLCGIAFGLLMTTKVLGLILILVIGVLVFQLILPEEGLPERRRTSIIKWIQKIVTSVSPQKALTFFFLFLCGFIVSYTAVWQMHFSLGKNVVESLPDGGYYQASDEYKELIDADKTSFPIMLQDSHAFVSHYNGGVPELNLCKEDENGSPWYFWPFGGRGISYRWQTPDSTVYRYVYLVANPVVWYAGLIGVILGFVMLVGSWFIDGAKPLRYRWHLLFWGGMYVSYMIAVSQIDRVMYLYHYFLPLIFSFFVLTYVLLELTKIGPVIITETIKQFGLLIFAFVLFLSFQFFKPLTYSMPLDHDQFAKRSWMEMWGLRCATCERDYVLAKPL